MILQMRVSWLMMLLLLWLTAAAAGGTPVVKPGCQEMCGNVSVPYPFGIGEPNCAMNEDFFLNCSYISHGRSNLFFRNFPILNVSVLEGTVTLVIKAASPCYEEVGNLGRTSITLAPGPFVFSETRNIFTAIGCDTLATVTNSDYTYGAACLSLCGEILSLSDKKSCSGSGYCQIPIPKGLKSLDIRVFSLKSLDIKVFSLYRYTNVSDFYPCGYAFLVDRRSFKISDWQLSPKALDRKDPPTQAVVVEWVAKNETCEQAKANASAYACRNNTNCTDSEHGQGYRCLCKAGFEGNPYLEQGCQDIDECKNPQRNPCKKGTCQNTVGSYSCKCALVTCRAFHIPVIPAVTVPTTSVVIIGLLLYIILVKKSKDKNFRENGGKVLKQQRIKIFTELELAKATSNYDSHNKLGEGGFGCVYKGVLADNSQVAIKKFKAANKGQMNEEFGHEICVVLQVNHKHVVKLLGLCLHTKMPLLVYEFISNGNLSQHIHQKKTAILRTWTSRLRIAAETALALEYFHSLANPPIIHRDIKPANILLDENYTVKVADFGASVVISPGQDDIVSKIKGTLGYADPEYLITGNVTVKSDVYSFGVVLLELLTGAQPSSISRFGENGNIIQYFITSFENNSLVEILDFEVAEGELDEIQLVAELAKRCVSRSGVRRPNMKEVSDELARLTTLHDDLWAQRNSVETENLLVESSGTFYETATSTFPPPSLITVSSFGIESYTDSI